MNGIRYQFSEESAALVQEMRSLSKSLEGIVGMFGFNWNVSIKNIIDPPK